MMKKIFCGIALVAGLVSCTESYTDWKAPQHNDQEDMLPQTVLMVEPTEASYDFASETREVIQLFTANMKADQYIVTLSGEGTTNTSELVADENCEIPAEAIAAAVAEVYGGGPEERVMHAKVSANVLLGETGIYAAKEASPFTFTAKLPAGVIFDTDPVLFLTGNNYGWGATWVPLVPVNGHPTLSWIIIYLHAGEEFKFAPQQDWGGDFGMAANIVDNAGMNPSGDNNIVVGNPGWYLIEVNNDPEGEGQTVTFSKPNIYLIGNTAAAGWSIDESGLFTVPDSENGQFVSPAFANDGEVRMCVILDAVGTGDWWRSEFIVMNGQIDYRAGGGDQARVTVSQGQRCYLNFSNGSGVYK